MFCIYIVLLRATRKLGTHIDWITSWNLLPLSKS